MSGLSNFFRWRDATSPAEPPVIRPVAAGEVPEGLRLLLGTGGKKADELVVNDFVGFAAHRDLPLDSMWVAVAGGKLIASALPVPSPGRTALLMTSTAGSSSITARAVADCADSACRSLDSSSIELAQFLLEPGEHRTVVALCGVGCEKLATLIYLQRALRATPPAPLLPPGCELLTYSAETHSNFCRGILASYEQSLDCPALHGKRGIDDVIAGHQSSGEFTPDLWFCLVEAGIELGVLLLSPVPGHQTMELVYIGLAPHARGRRLGDYLIGLAFHSTAVAGLRTLTLAVDEINVPALHLYHRHGLAEVHRRLAMIRLLTIE